MQSSKLKYSVIKSNEQYEEYCDTLEELLDLKQENMSDEIELLQLLIEKWDDDNSSFHEKDPIELLRFLMEENQLKSVDVANILKLSKGTVSKILNYRKGISKENIRKLSEYFKVTQEAFNRPYELRQNSI